jgi:DNA-binding MarR family transcriptional regulator
MTVIDRVRSLFHELKLGAQEVHGGSPLAGGMRGVLIDLLEDGDQTVPELARRRPVSRQHIQTLVNELLKLGLVIRKPNPMHKRSRLVGLTPEGHRTISGMLEREKELLQDLRLEANLDQLQDAADTLADLSSALRDPGWRSRITEA